MITTTTVVATIEGKCVEAQQGYVSYVQYREADAYNHATIRQEPGDESETDNESVRLTYIRGNSFQLGKKYRVTVEEITDDN